MFTSKAKYCWWFPFINPIHTGLILTNNLLNLIAANSIPKEICDYEMVGCVGKLNTAKLQPEKTTCLSYKNYNLKEPYAMTSSKLTGKDSII